tara:strand:+ start:5072 stop:5602 length:531 start_codon:yes stop_codon:yes gene_type:complete
MKRHCDLCDHQKLSLKEGTICGVTNRKPDFNKTCIKVNFGDKLKHQLEKVLIEYEELKQSKNKLYRQGYFRLIRGVIILAGGYFISSYFLDKGRVSLFRTGDLLIAPALIIIVGYYIIRNTINKLKSHKNQLINIEKEKIDIDEVLSIYNIKYDYKVNTRKETHGTIDMKIKINFK